MDVSVELSAKTSLILQSIKDAGLTDILHEPEMRKAHSLTASSLRRSIRQYAVSKFQNPTGALADSFVEIDYLSGDILAEVGSDLPYSRRRELGFHGADSLGRVYDDPGQLYVMEAIADEDAKIDGRYKRALNQLFDRVFLA